MLTAELFSVHSTKTNRLMKFAVVYFQFFIIISLIDSLLHA